MPKFISEFKEGEIVDFPTNRKYEFVRALKSGGTGKTILMQDTMLNKFFVCKKYSPMQKQYEKEFYNRFIDEIKIMYAIYDINIVRIFDYYLFPEHSTGYIIMECITTGKSLQEAISQITDALNLCLTVLEDEGIVPKRPTPKIDFPHLTTDILVSIQADTDEYRRAHIE